jgi:cyclase
MKGPLEVIPSLDLLHGKVVRLTRGDFDTARAYGDPEELFVQLGLGAARRLHVVDLEGSRTGIPTELDAVRTLARHDLKVQVGGGVRSLEDARRWFDCGVDAVVVGTVTADAPQLLETLVTLHGPERIIPAVDIRDGNVRTAGWEREATTSTSEIFARIRELGVPRTLVTDINRDGVLRGPAFELYREIALQYDIGVIASGGVSTVADVVSLARMGLRACVIGRALVERRISLRDAMRRVEERSSVPERVIPCLDLRDGRVVKGVKFENIRDAGDPVECARRYEAEGADELVILDIAATDTHRETALDTVRRVAGAIFIPLVVGGGVRSIDDFRALLRAGADRVAINTAALRHPRLIEECAGEFGVQAVVLSCDAKRQGQHWVATVRGGRETTAIDAIDWCRQAESLGAGEILLTSVDRDGTNTGFDLELLRGATSALRIGVIASGGAGRLEDFREAIETGGARAVLAASLFHDGVLTVEDVKSYLQKEGIPVRR